MNNPTDQIKRWAAFSFAALLMSVQALLLTMKVMDFLRPQSSPVFFLFCWLLFFAVGQVVAVWLEDHYKPTAVNRSSLLAFLAVEAILTFLLLSALVKMVFYDYRGEMAHRAYASLLVLIVLNKLFWPRIRQAGQEIYALVNDRANQGILRQLVIAGGSVLLILIIFVPDHRRVIARDYVGEQLHHYDISMMAPEWAAYNGHIIDIDQISQYGLGIPYIFAQLLRWMGGVSYEHVFVLLMAGVIIYYVLLFWFSQYWFKSAALTLAVILCGIRVQMFHPGVYPFALTYPSATVIRFFFDIFFFAAIYCHLRRGRRGWLLLAGALGGFSVFYLDSTGVFLAAAYWAYLVCLWTMPYTRRLLYKTPREMPVLAAYFLAPVAVALGLFWKVVGTHLLTERFWYNFSETVEYFLSGIGTYPIYENFKYHNFFAGLMGLIIPAVWVFTILFIGAMCYLKKFSRRHILVIVVSVYGLGLDHYYIARAVLTSYYVDALPFIFVCGYWLKLLFFSWPARRRRNAVLISLALSLYALFTNHNFMAYPNVFNWSHNPMVDPLTAQPLPADLSTYFHHLYRNSPENLKLPTNSLGEQDEELYTERNFLSDDDLAAYYRQDFDFSKDAKLIQDLTRPGEPVPVISDFEIKILIQADRPPFFYYFPLINSRSKHMRIMPGSAVHTNARRFNQTAIDQLKRADPPYVFMERIFLYDFPKAYTDQTDNIIPIVTYVRDHYAPYLTGEYLVAMKHK